MSQASQTMFLGATRAFQNTLHRQDTLVLLRACPSPLSFFDGSDDCLVQELERMRMMSVFLLACSLFVALVGALAFRDVQYARQTASNGNGAELRP